MLEYVVWGLVSGLARVYVVSFAKKLFRGSCLRSKRARRLFEVQDGEEVVKVRDADWHGGSPLILPGVAHRSKIDAD